MAQPAKILATGAANQLAPSRGVPGTPVAGLDFRPETQAPAAGMGVMFEGAQFTHERGGRDYGFSNDNRGDRYSPPQSWSLVQTPSDTFARILESMMGGGEVDGTGAPSGGPGKQFQNVVARAIAIYESNAKIIHGELALVGATVSIRF